MKLNSIENVILNSPIFDTRDKMSELDPSVLVQVWAYKENQRIITSRKVYAIDPGVTSFMPLIFAWQPFVFVFPPFSSNAELGEVKLWRKN